MFLESKNSRVYLAPNYLEQYASKQVDNIDYDYTSLSKKYRLNGHLNILDKI